MRLFWIQIERKTDILALAAFLIALSAVLVQMVAFFRGPEVRLFPPAQVLIYGDRFVGDEIHVRFSATMAYVNQGQVGYNATVASEELRYKVAGEEYTQIWQRFWQTDLKDGKLFIDPDKQEPARPTPVLAGSSASHETLFSPKEERCASDDKECEHWDNLVSWEQFMDLVSRDPTLEFELVAKIHGQKTPENARCIVELEPNAVAFLREEKWFAPSCWPID